MITNSTFFNTQDGYTSLLMCTTVACSCVRAGAVLSDSHKLQFNKAGESQSIQIAGLDPKAKTRSGN